MERRRDTIFIVDDDEDDLMFLKEAFAQVGLVKGITLYASPTAFLDTLFVIEALPLLTVLDYNMPQKTGEDVLLEMKKHPQFTTTKVIILSTGMHKELEKRMQALGAYCCISKPDTPDGYILLANQFKKMLSDHYQGKAPDMTAFQ